MSFPTTTTMVYLQNNEMVLFYDIRRLTDLLTDNGTGDSLTPTQINTVTQNPGDPGTLLWQAIATASGEIDAKCQNGQRYYRADLETIVQNSVNPPAGSSASDIEAYNKRAAILKKLCADLAFGYLSMRRAQTADQLRELAPAYEEALTRLEDLYNGRKLFDLAYALGASIPNLKVLGRTAPMSSAFNRMFGVWPDQWNGLYPGGGYYPGGN